MVEDDTCTLIPKLRLHCRPIKRGRAQADDGSDSPTQRVNGSLPNKTEKRESDLNVDSELLTDCQLYQILDDDQWKQAVEQLEAQEHQVLSFVEMGGDGGKTSSQVKLLLSIVLPDVAADLHSAFAQVAAHLELPLDISRTVLFRLCSASLVAPVPIGDELRYANVRKLLVTTCLDASPRAPQLRSPPIAIMLGDSSL